jgi:hypothetical protein
MKKSDCIDGWKLPRGKAEEIVLQKFIHKIAISLFKSCFS